MGVNGSVTPADFTYTATAPCALERVLFSVVDNAGEDIDGFFTIAALSTGLTIQHRNSAGTVLQHFSTDVAAIQRHADFTNLAGVDVGATSDTPAVTRAGVRWTIGKAGAKLRMEAGDVFGVTVSDDLSAILQFRTMAQGLLI